MNMGNHAMAGGLHWPLLAMGLAGLVVIALLGVVVLCLLRPAKAYGAPGKFALAPAALDAIATATVSTDAHDRISNMAIVIPDISGYTDYMNHSRYALSHAQYVVGELLTATAAAARPELSVCRPEGDALLLYRNLEQDEDWHISDTLVTILAAFYQRRQELAEENACLCQACTRIDTLELKMIVHRGPVLETHMAGFHTLAGIPVIEAHRLLKNAATTHHYLLVTAAAAPLLIGLPDWPRTRLTEIMDDGNPLDVVVYCFEPSKLPRAEAEGQLPRAVKKACDLCRKVGHGLKQLGPT